MKQHEQLDGRCAVQVKANLQEELIAKVIAHVELALTVSELLKFQIVYLQKLGQGN